MSPDLLFASAPALIIALLLAGVRRVPEGSAFTVHRFGRYARTLAPGLRFALPLVERVSGPVELINHRIQLPLESGGEADGAALFYQIIEPERSGDMLERIDAVVEREARLQLDALLAGVSRDSELLNGRFKQALNERLASLGLRVTRCQLGA